MVNFNQACVLTPIANSIMSVVGVKLRNIFLLHQINRHSISSLKTRQIFNNLYIYIYIICRRLSRFISIKVLHYFK